jgi:hypothetical protein
VSDRFEVCFAKIARARERFREIHRELLAYPNSDAYSVLIEEDQETGGDLIEVTIRRETEIRWAVVLGEIVYNLHSALDQAVCVLVRIGNPSSSCRDRAFPIYPTPLKPGERRAELRSVPALAHKIIEGHQPHVGTDGPRYHPLWQLRELSLRDKHREPAFFGRVVISEFEADAWDEEAGSWATREDWTSEYETTFSPTVTTRPDGARTYRYVVPPPENMRMKLQPTVYVAFEKPRDLRWQHVQSVIGDMIREVEAVLTELRAAFP